MAAVLGTDGPDHGGAGAPLDVPPDVAARLVRALDQSPDRVVALLDADLTTRWVGHSAAWILGQDPRAREGGNALDFVHPDDVERLVHGLDVLRAARRAEDDGIPAVGVEVPIRYRYERSDGRWVVLATVHNLLDAPGVEGLLIESRLVGGRVEGVGHVVDLLVSQAPLHDVLTACANLVPPFVGDAAVVGFVDGELVVGAPPGSPVADLVADVRWWGDAAADRRSVTPRAFAGFPADLAARAREHGYVTAWIYPFVEDGSPDVMGCVVVSLRIDVTPNIASDDVVRQIERLAILVIGEERRLRELRREALTDPLTGLGNRAALRRRLDAATGPVTVAIVDLDEFKPINDTFGHDAGDAALQVVAERLVSTVRADDLVVRFGGDEFAVVFSAGTATRRAASVAQRIVTAIEAPITLDGQGTITVGASIGHATGAADEVVHAADDALYAAKRAKRSAPSPAAVDRGAG